ncbi:unnamed protein product [Closterium sp. NIES-54]
MQVLATGAGAGDGRLCWCTRLCTGAHGCTRLRVAMRGCCCVRDGTGRGRRCARRAGRNRQDGKGAIDGTDRAQEAQTRRALMGRRNEAASDAVAQLAITSRVTDGSCATGSTKQGATEGAMNENKPSRSAAAAPPSSCRAAQQQPSRPAAAEPPSSSRAAQQQPSSPGAAELPSDHRATQPTLPDDLQLFLQCDRADGLSLFDLTSGASPAPPADADPTVRSQWATRDAAARLAVRRHLPTTERAHFSQCKTAQALYNAVVARYSSPATAALSRLALPFLFPDLAAFPTVADLITHLRTIDARYRAALPADFCAKNPPPHLREWYTQRPRGGAFGPCTYVLRTGDRAGEQCGGTHSAQRCFRRLTDAWRQQFPEAVEIPRWGELSRAGVAIFDLDFDAILAAMYAMTISEEGDCYRCFPPDPGIGTSALGTGEASALGACETALSGTASASAPLTFTLDSGASRSFFRDRTTLTPLSRPVAVSLADPSGGPILSSFSTVLPCPAAPSGTLSGLYLPSFSTNLVSGAALQDAGVHQFTPAGQRVTHCTEARTGRHLATFTRQPGSSLYTLSTSSPPVPESIRVLSSGQVFATASRSGPESAPCSCRRLSHETLLWHHRLGHPSLLRLRGMASRLLVSGLPRSLPPLPPGPGPTCVPCVEGRQRAAPHSSQFPPTEAPLQTCVPCVHPGVASDGAAHSMPGMERNKAATGTQGPREVRRHVDFATTSGNNDIMALMPLKPQRAPCFDPSQRGDPIVQSWVFTMNDFFDANYVESGAAKIRYAVSLLRGPAMDWWQVIVTSETAYLVTTRVGPRLHERFSRIMRARRLHARRGAVDRYVGGLKPDISHKIMLRGLSNFNEILALAEKIDILRRPRPWFYHGQRSRGPAEHATVYAVAANAAAAPLKGRCFDCNRAGHRKSECPEELRRRGAEQGRES